MVSNASQRSHFVAEPSRSECSIGSSQGITTLQEPLAGVQRMYSLAARSTKYLLCLLLTTALQAAITQPAPSPNGTLKYRAKRGAPLTLIDNSDPRFTSELNVNFPGVLSMGSIETALPYMVILRNDTAKTVRAYEIRWEDSEGNSDQANGLVDLKATAVTTPLELRWPSGSKVQDKSIRPGEERLVTPWSNVRHDELAFFEPSFGQTLRPEASRRSLKAHVDCVVYGDGSLNGPNKSRLLLTYFITRDAQHDEALTIVQRLRAAPKDPKLKSELLRRRDIAGSPSFNSDRAMSTYKHARGAAAQEFFQLLQTGGYNAVLNMASELVSTMPPHERFTQMAAHYRQAQFKVGDVAVRAEE